MSDVISGISGNSYPAYTGNSTGRETTELDMEMSAARQDRVVEGRAAQFLKPPEGYDSIEQYLGECKMEHLQLMSAIDDSHASNGTGSGVVVTKLDDLDFDLTQKRIQNSNSNTRVYECPDYLKDAMDWIHRFEQRCISEDMDFSEAEMNAVQSAFSKVENQHSLASDDANTKWMELAARGFAVASVKKILTAADVSQQVLDFAVNKMQEYQNAQLRWDAEIWEDLGNDTSPRKEYSYGQIITYVDDTNSFSMDIYRKVSNLRVDQNGVDRQELGHLLDWFKNGVRVWASADYYRAQRTESFVSDYASRFARVAQAFGLA